MAKIEAKQRRQKENTEKMRQTPTKMAEIEAKQRRQKENTEKMRQKQTPMKWLKLGSMLKDGMDLWPVAISVSVISKT